MSQHYGISVATSSVNYHRNTASQNDIHNNSSNGYYQLEYLDLSNPEEEDEVETTQQFDG